MPDEFYETHPCAPELLPFVRRYMYADAVADITIRPAPTGYVYFGYSFSAGHIASIIDGVSKSFASSWHFAGQVGDKEIAVRISGHAGHLLAELTPAGFYRLFKIPASRITNQSMEVHEIDAALAQRLQPALAGTRDRGQCLRGFDALLASMIPGALQ